MYLRVLNVIMRQLKSGSKLFNEVSGRNSLNCESCVPELAAIVTLQWTEIGSVMVKEKEKLMVDWNKQEIRLLTEYKKTTFQFHVKTVRHRQIAVSYCSNCLSEK